MEQYNTNNEVDFSKYIAALDIGTTKVVALLGEVVKENGRKKINVISYGIAPTQGMKRGMINDLGKVIDAIKEATTQARFIEDFGIKEVYVGVSGHTVKSQIIKHYKNIPSGVISEKDILELKKDVHRTVIKDNEVVLHVIPHSYVIDKLYEHQNPIGIEARHLSGEFYVITADKFFIQSVQKAVLHAGLKPIGIIFEPLASAEAVLMDEEKEAGVALIDIGGGTTDILIMHNNKTIHSEVIPFGGESITEDIRKALQVLKNIAEEMKIKHGNAIALKHLDSKIIEIPALSGRSSRSIRGKALAVIIQSRLIEIIDTINEIIKPYIENGYLAAGLTITGGTSLTSDIEALIKNRIGLDVRLAAPHLTDIEELNAPQFATTQGLILIGDRIKEKSSIGQNENNDRPEEGVGAGILNKMRQWFKDLFDVEPDDVDE